MKRSAKKEVCRAACLPAELAEIILVEHITIGIALRRNEPSAVGHTTRVRIDRRLRTTTRFQHLHIDVVAVLGGSRLILRVSQDLLEVAPAILCVA